VPKVGKQKTGYRRQDTEDRIQERINFEIKPISHRVTKKTE